MERKRLQKIPGTEPYLALLMCLCNSWGGGYSKSEKLGNLHRMPPTPGADGVRHPEWGLGHTPSSGLGCGSGGAQCGMERASPTNSQAGHTVPCGVRTLPTCHSVYHAGFLSKLPVFWEQEAAIYHQENMVGERHTGWLHAGRKGGAELDGEVPVIYSVYSPGSAGSQSGLQPSLNHCALGLSHSQ